MDSDFEVSLQTFFAVPTVFDDEGNVVSEASVWAIPLWHFNQYSHGVVPGVNGGGPDPAGYVCRLRSLARYFRLQQASR